MKAGIIFSLTVLLTLVLAFSLVIFAVTLSDLPHIPDDLRNLVYARPTEVYAADGTLVHRLGGRSYVTLDQISPQFLQAVVATEDGNFHHHSGIDKRAWLRAIYMNLTGQTFQGASTITQQLSKYLFFTFERTVTRKVKETLISLQLEAMFSKKQILEAYCNFIYFGGTAYGIEDAARQYFGKNAADLDLPEAALLAGILNSPYYLNPYSHFDRAKSRQALVLGRMQRRGLITAEDNQQAFAAPLVFSTVRTNGNDFIDYVISEAQQQYGSEAVQFGGLRIYTTLDPALQALAEQTLAAGLSQLDGEVDSTGSPLQGALVATAVSTGEVKALVGARAYIPGGYNRAVNANRHVGSGVKPFVYTAAIEELGYTPATVVYDTATVFHLPEGTTWRPRNFDRRHRGPLIMKAALMQSINMISAQLTAKLTPHEVVSTLRRFGLSSAIDEVMSVSLGAAGVSPLELASAYAVIANNGVYYRPLLIKRVEDVNGIVLDRAFSFGEPRFDPRVTYQVLDMMRAVVDNGTAAVIRRLGFSEPAAGKTGTSTEFTDAWFTGFTTSLSTSVWVGYDRDFQIKTTAGRGMDGGRAAAPIWAEFMKQAVALYPARDFLMPEGLKQVTVNTTTGAWVAEPQDGISVVVPQDYHPSYSRQPALGDELP